MTPHDVRAVAVAAHVSDKTVARYLRGEPVRPTIRTRIVDALVGAGWISREEGEKRLASQPSEAGHA